MSPEQKVRLPAGWYRVLAGLEAGELGGLVMLCWVALAALLERRPLWALPTALGAIFYGRSALYSPWGAPAVAGLALHLATSGLLGILFALLARESHNRLRVMLLGVLAGLTWFYLAQALIWRRLPLPAAWYAPPSSAVLGHVLYGLVLGGYPARLRSLRRGFEGPLPADQDSAGTSRSGLDGVLE